jgi:hypothetical protein
MIPTTLTFLSISIYKLIMPKIQQAKKYTGGKIAPHVVTTKPTHFQFLLTP